MVDTPIVIDWDIAVEELLGPGAQYASAATYEELTRTWGWKHLPVKQDGIPEEKRDVPTRVALVAAYEQWQTKQTVVLEAQDRRARLKSPESMALLREEIEDATNTSQLKSALLKVLDLIETLT